MVEGGEKQTPNQYGVVISCVFLDQLTLKNVLKSNQSPLGDAVQITTYLYKVLPANNFAVCATKAGTIAMATSVAKWCTTIRHE